MSEEVEEVIDTDYVPESSEETTSETPAEGSAETEEGAVKTNKEPDYKKMLLDTKRAFTKTAMEKAELAGKLSAMEQQIRSLAEEKSQKETPDWLQEVNFESLAQDPNAIKEVFNKLRGEVAGVLRARDEYYENRLRSVNPEILAYKDKIAEFKADPDYSDFTDEQLARLAKREVSKSASGKSAEVKVPGAVGKGRNSIPNGNGDDIRKSDLYKRIYGE